MRRELDAIRREIDEADAEILAAFLRRMRLTREAGEIKAARNLPVYDTKRERELLSRVRGSVGDDSLRAAAESLFVAMLEISKQDQRMRRAGHVYLTGLMGCGKSALGKRLAERLGWDFVDLDARVEEAERKPIATIFAECGEAAFRAAETKTLRAFAEGNFERSVVATGGGVVIAPENVAIMRESGLVILIDRPVEAIAREIDASGRPLLAGDPEKLRAIAAARAALYRESCDAVFENEYANADEAADALRAQLIRLVEQRDRRA